MSLHPDLDKIIVPGLGMSMVPLPSGYDLDYWNGRLLVFEAPRSGHRYALGVDVAEGVGQDRSVIQVLRIGTTKEPDEQVAEFASDHHDPIDLATLAASVGRFYHDDSGEEALIIPECNGVGNGIPIDLQARLNYGNVFIWKVYDKMTNQLTNRLGWWTNRSTRPKLIAQGLHALTKRDLIVNSPFCLDEMEDFERDPFLAKAKARFGRHDDRIMALLIAYWGAHDEEWLTGEDVAEQRRLLTQAKGIQHTKEAAIGTKATWQNTAVTSEEMLAAWDDWMEGS